MNAKNEMIIIKGEIKTSDVQSLYKLGFSSTGLSNILTLCSPYEYTFPLLNSTSHLMIVKKDWTGK